MKPQQSSYSHEPSIPVPAQGEVVVQIKAKGRSHAGVQSVQDSLPQGISPQMLALNFAGVVVDGPTEWRGRKVWGTGNQIGVRSHPGYIVLSANAVAPKPQSLSFVEASNMALPYALAWDALERSQVASGARLLVIGATSALGQAAIALAKVRGARVLAAVRRPDELAAFEAREDESLLLGKPEHLAAQVNAVFTGGADVIFDTTGFWLSPAVSALAPFGCIAIIAEPESAHVKLPALALYRKGGAVVGIGSLLKRFEVCAGMLERVGRLLDEGLIPTPSVGLVGACLEDRSAERRHEGGSAVQTQ